MYTDFKLSEIDLKYMQPCPFCHEKNNLMAKHGFGAQIICTKCDIAGTWVPGSDYQEEERIAIIRWDDDVKKAIASGETLADVKGRKETPS